MKPSVGRIVHYVSFGTPGGEYESECRAAVITEVQDDPQSSVGLCVLNPAGQFFNRAVPYHEGDAGHDHSGAGIPARSYPGGTWHWPEREPPDLPGLEPHPLNLSPGQVREVVAAVQASLLQQAKRSRKTGLQLPGRGAEGTA
jgi:hypothetical protein